MCYPADYSVPDPHPDLDHHGSHLEVARLGEFSVDRRTGVILGRASGRPLFKCRRLYMDVKKKVIGGAIICQIPWLNQLVAYACYQLAERLVLSSDG